MVYPFSKNNAISLVFFALLALSLGIGCYVFSTGYTNKHKISPPITATQISQTQGLPEFLLTDDSGHPFTNQSLKGHYSFLFFGYSHCQGICPMTMAMLTQLYTQLEKQQLPLPQIVFITLDPKRDTQKVISQYVHAFNPAFRGITGPVANIQRLSKQMGVVYIKAQQEKQNDTNYQLDHSGTLYLTDPAGELIAVFSPPHEKDSIAQDYKSLIRMQ